MSSFSFTDTVAFTLTHAKHIAAKVATDLKRMQRFYGYPSDTFVSAYESELVELLKMGYLETVTYGFQKNNNWIEPTLKYTARELSNIGNDDDPGRVLPGANVEGAFFTSFLSYSSAWSRLAPSEQSSFKSKLPFQRTSGETPGVSGYFTSDKSYSAGGRGLDRSTLKSH